MNKYLLCLCLLVLLPKGIYAQWKTGVTLGASLNHYSIDRHYMENIHYGNEWGKLMNISGLGTVGVMGQYDLTNWFGIRAELGFIQKNYCQYRSDVKYSYVDNKTFNSFIQLPLMVSFKHILIPKLSVFTNLGGYGSYWTDSRLKGNVLSNSVKLTVDLNQDFNSKKDQRLSFGWLGGVGAEYNLTKRLSLQIEARYYYSTTSMVKDYMKIKDPRYNNTWTFQTALCYSFIK